jgi:hypothetical protein
MKSLYPPNIFLSPRWAIQRMNDLVQNYGKPKALTDVNMKEEREAAITGLFLLGYRLLTQKDFWIEICQDDPPDNRAISPTKRPEGRGMVKEVINLEVFEWEGHSTHSLTGAIQEKLKGKKYPPDYFLLCQVRRPGEIAELEKCYQDLQREKPGVAEVWAVFSIEDAQFDYVIVRLFPSRAEKRFKLSDEIAATKEQKDGLRELGRGFMDKPEVGEDLQIPLP